MALYSANLLSNWNFGRVFGLLLSLSRLSSSILRNLTRSLQFCIRSTFFCFQKAFVSTSCGSFWCFFIIFSTGACFRIWNKSADWFFYLFFALCFLLRSLSFYLCLSASFLSFCIFWLGSFLLFLFASFFFNCHISKCSHILVLPYNVSF